jgi:hypothetical protein
MTPHAEHPDLVTRDRGVRSAVPPEPGPQRKIIVRFWRTLVHVFRPEIIGSGSSICT